MSAEIISLEDRKRSESERLFESLKRAFGITTILYAARELDPTLNETCFDDADAD